MMKIFYQISIIILISIYTVHSADECKTNDDCYESNHCDPTFKMCKHDRIFTNPLSEMIGLIIIVVGSALSNAGGIGGGGLLIPILLLVMKFYTHEAIPISKLMIFTGALTSFIIGFRQKHPFRNSISIDYNLPLLLVPMLLFGTMVGVTLNKVTPPWIILVSLSAILIINTYKTLKKGLSLYKSENNAINLEKKHLAKEQELTIDKNSSSIDYNRKNKTNTVKLFDDDENSGHSNKIDEKDVRELNTINMSAGNIEELLKEEEKKDLAKYPVDKLIYMIICYFVMLLISFLKGSDYVNSIIGVQLCTFQYWLIYFLYLPFGVLMTYLASKNILKEYKYRISIGYPYNETDIKWNNNLFLKFPLYSFSSGLMAGLLGIGGGLILGPLLLELGLHPVVSTATSNFLVLFTSSSTSIQFILLGMMNVDFGIACTIASSIGSFLGTILIQKLISITKRNSYLIFALGAVLGVSTILIPAHALMKMIDQINEGKSIWKFNRPC